MTIIIRKHYVYVQKWSFKAILKVFWHKLKSKIYLLNIISNNPHQVYYTFSNSAHHRIVKNCLVSNYLKLIHSSPILNSITHTSKDLKVAQ